MKTKNSAGERMENLAKEFIIGYKPLTKTQRRLVEQREMADREISKLSESINKMKQFREEIINALFKTYKNHKDNKENSKR
jgi:ubiquitin C-terminal hydrolase